MSDRRQQLTAAASSSADAKPAGRRSGGGSSKRKSTRSFSQAATMAVDGGNRVEPRFTDESRERMERPDYMAPSKDSARPDTASGSHSSNRTAAKRGTRKQGRQTSSPSSITDTWRIGGAGVGATGGNADRVLHQSPADCQVSSSGRGPGQTDRAILDKCKPRESIVVSGGNDPSSGRRSSPQETPAETVDGEGYGEEEAFEEYSDEFEGEEEDGDERQPSVALAVPSAPPTRLGEIGARFAGTAVVSPALKMRPDQNLQAPDDKALQELRHSLREENNIARERKISKPATVEAFSAADEKNPSRSSRGAAKGAKGSKRGSTREGNKMAERRGHISTDGSLDGKPARLPKSNFVMADAKALTRALTKGKASTKQMVPAISALSRLEAESVRLFDQPPVTLIDLYQRRLRAQPALIRQVASQTNDDARSMDTQTEEIMLADKEAQFHLGHDDTALENLMKRLRSTHRRTRGTGECKDVEEHKDEKECVPLRMGLEDGAGLPTTVEEALPGEPMNTPTVAPQPQRLGNFLRRVCVVMETLCEENLSSVAARGGLGIHDPEDEEDGEDVGGGKRSLFPGGGASNDGWEEVGANDAAGLESLIGSAAVVGIAFSRAKRSMLVTAHARPMRREVTVTGGDAGSSERNPAAEGLEGCGVVCVWNSEAPMEAPVSVLFGEGVFTCLCPALCQPHVVLVGTAEGCLLLWDLRDPVSASHAKQARELSLQCGLRPPTYTTAGGVGGGAGIVNPVFGHASTIVSAVAIPNPESHNAGGVGVGEILSLGESDSFQVASLDDRGTVSIWVVTEAKKIDEGGSQTDLGLSPGGRLRLTLSKSLQPGAELGGLGVSRSEFSRASFDPTISAGTFSITTSAAAVRALAFSPEDPNRFIVSGTGESITHASRLGNSPLPRAFRSPRLPSRAGRIGPVTCERIGAGVIRGSVAMCREEGRGMGGISCLSFSSFFRKIFLAGCGDGSIRLYKDDCAVPLTVWEGFSARDPDPRNVSEATVSAHDGGGRGFFGGCPAAISSVAWSEHRPAVFFALDSAGTLHGFDLLEDDAGPVASARGVTCATSSRERKGAEFGMKRATGMEVGGFVGRSPLLSLSSETLSTGSRPRVALGVEGRVFTRRLSRSMFIGLIEKTAPGKGSVQQQGTIEGLRAVEKERMEQWLRAVF